MVLRYERNFNWKTPHKWMFQVKKRHLLYYASRRNQSATKTARDIYLVCGNDAITYRTTKKRFVKFETGIRPSEFDNDHLKAR